MRGPRPLSCGQSRPTAGREPAHCRHSSRNRARRGCEHGNRSGTARLSRLGNSSHCDPGCWRRDCCNSRVRLAGSKEKVSGGKARGDTLGGPFPDRRAHVPTGLAAHATVVCISGIRSLLRPRVVSGYHRSLGVLLTVVGGSIGVNSTHVIYWIITQSNFSVCETDGSPHRVASATRCEAKG
jgi:hypothetical protein